MTTLDASYIVKLPYPRLSRRESSRKEYQRAGSIMWSHPAASWQHWQTAGNATPAPAKEKGPEKLVKHPKVHRIAPIFSPLPLTSSPSFRSLPFHLSLAASGITNQILGQPPTHPPPSHRTFHRLMCGRDYLCLLLTLCLLLFFSSPSLYSPLYLLFIGESVGFLPVCVLRPLSPSFIHSSQQRESLSSLFTSSVRPSSISCE